MILNISGIEIEINKKDIKHLHLYVKPPNGRVSVSAPLSMPDEAIERFVRIKLSWIKKQREKYETQPRQSKREYLSGESFYVMGKQYYLQVNYGFKNSLLLSGNKAILTVRKESTIKQREHFVREWYRELLKIEINKYLPKWEEKTGIKCTDWQTKYMTTRWGTCNRTQGKIWFNLMLAKKTPECLEYVILHELLHFEEKNHTERFISLMDKYMPLWREIKNSLNGQILDFL